VKIVVSNLSFKTTKTEIKDLFARHGEVARVRLAAVVTMPDKEQASNAMEALQGQLLQGRVLTFRKARSSKSNSKHSKG
jgi:RNA recognition motif-containing protein